MQKLTNNTQHDLPGRYTLADGSKLAVYGPQQWFTPCAWNDWTCAVSGTFCCSLGGGPRSVRQGQCLAFYLSCATGM